MKENLNILIIEDDPDDCFLITKTLKEIRFKTSLTFSSDLRSMNTSLSYDLILLDLNLPDSQGLNSFLTVYNKFPSCPIIILGGLDDENLAREAIHLGAQDYLPKIEINAKLLARVIRYAIERQQLHENLKKLMFTDELTGLYNRRGFMTLLETHISLIKRTKAGFFLFLMDVDYLKKINDTYGHLFGDIALKEAGNCLKLAFRGHDIIGRIGGDEFAVIVVNANPIDEAVLKSQIHAVFDKFNEQKKVPFPLTISTGCAFYYSNKEKTIDEIFQQADKDLYKEKKAVHCT